MEQHPVPQQISSYQFRLVGDMTLKQFFELAGGALVGLLFYTTTIPALFKWPLIIASVLFGIALAFLPFEDRPLEIWVVAFFRSIYSPTHYFWQRTTIKPKYFQDETGETPDLGIIAPRGEAELKKYLAEKPGQKDSFFKKLEDVERGFLSKVTGLFTKPAPAQNASTAQLQQTTANAAPLAQVQAQPQVQVTPATVQQPVAIPIPIQPITMNPPMTVETFKEVQTQPITPVPVQMPQTFFDKPNTTQTSPSQEIPMQAQFSVSASPPMPPTQPNTLSGQVMDSAGRIVDSAILEIKDGAGRPVRAVKTNKLGHFFIVTPLSDGQYEILTEKEGYEFSPLKFIADGKLIPSMAIRAKQA